METTEVKTETPVTTNSPAAVPTTEPTTPDINKFSAAELKEFVNRSKEAKTDVTIPPEKKIEELKKPETVVETKTEPVKQEPVKTEPPVAEPEKAEIVDIDVLRKQLKDEVMAEIRGKEVETQKAKEAEAKKAEQYLNKLTDEEAREMYEKDPALYIKKLTSSIRDELAKEITETVTGKVSEGLKPNIDVIEQNTLRNYVTEASNKYPELKDPNFLKSIQPFLNENIDLIDREAKKGKNPYDKMMKLYRAETYDKDIAKVKEEARMAGIKEGEEKVKNANKTFVEGGGKPASETVPDIDKMSSAELAKYLPRKERK